MSIWPLWRVLVISTCLLSLSAESHTRLISSEPVHGQVLEQAPKQLLLKFTAPIEARFSLVEMARGDSQAWQVLTTHVDGKTIRCELPGLAPAVYHVRWRVLAKDGHAQRGQFKFELR